MFTLSLICPRCGNRVTREIDEQFFPPALWCKCGTKMPLTWEKEQPRSYAVPGYGEESDVPEKVPSGRAFSKDTQR